MRRRHRRNQAAVELDITAFLNLMIVLVPVLLLSMVFTQTRAINLNFPDPKASATGADVEALQIRVTLSGDRIVLASNRDGLIAEIEPDSQGQTNGKERRPDFAALTEALKQLKRESPDKRDIALLAMPETDYQTLISAMDAIRSYPAVVATSVVPAELFPDIALGNAPAFAAAEASAQGEPQ